MQCEVAYVRADLAAPPPAVAQEETSDGFADETCPNCCTPWKCNGPHIPHYSDEVDDAIQSIIAHHGDDGAAKAIYDEAVAWLHSAAYRPVAAPAAVVRQEEDI